MYQMVTSDANGDVLFPYLPRLEEGEAYVVFEQPDAGAIGDDPEPYLNPVSRGCKAYYDFKKRRTQTTARPSRMFPSLTARRAIIPSSQAKS